MSPLKWKNKWLYSEIVEYKWIFSERHGRNIRKKTKGKIQGNKSYYSNAVLKS